MSNQVIVYKKTIFLDRVDEVEVSIEGQPMHNPSYDKELQRCQVVRLVQM